MRNNESMRDQLRTPCGVQQGHVPPIATVRLSPSGETWVRRLQIDPAAPTRVDVFDRSGVYLGTITRENFDLVLLLPGDRVGVVETDENDVSRLAVFAMIR